MNAEKPVIAFKKNMANLSKTERRPSDRIRQGRHLRGDVR